MKDHLAIGFNALEEIDMTDALRIPKSERSVSLRVQDKRNIIIYSEHRFSGMESLVVAETIKSDDGEGREMEFGYCETPFGTCFVGKLGQYICHFAFVEPNEIERELSNLKQRWPLAKINSEKVNVDDVLNFALAESCDRRAELKILLRGSRFQLAVWKQVLKVRRGEIVSYQEVANRLGRPDSVRAVGTAIGKNEIALLIPCHRVVSVSGAIGQYRWGTERKKCMLSHERAVFVV